MSDSGLYSVYLNGRLAPWDLHTITVLCKKTRDQERYTMLPMAGASSQVNDT